MCIYSEGTRPRNMFRLVKFPTACSSMLNKRRYKKEHRIYNRMHAFIGIIDTERTVSAFLCARLCERGINLPAKLFFVKINDDHRPHLRLFNRSIFTSISDRFILCLLIVFAVYASIYGVWTCLFAPLLLKS